MLLKFQVHQIKNKIKYFLLQKRFFDITRYERLKYPRTSDIKVYVADNDSERENGAHFISEKFLKSDPLHIAYKIEPNKENSNILKHLWLDEMQFNMTLIAKLNLDQSICGVCINHFFDQEREEKLFEKYSKQTESLKLCPLYDFFKAKYEITKNGKFNDKKTCELGAVAIEKSFSNNLRLDERLVRESLILAKLGGYKQVICECSSTGFRELLESLGFCISWQELIKNLPGDIENKNEEYLETSVFIYNKDTDWHKRYEE